MQFKVADAKLQVRGRTPAYRVCAQSSSAYEITVIQVESPAGQPRGITQSVFTTASNAQRSRDNFKGNANFNLSISICRTWFQLSLVNVCQQSRTLGFETFKKIGLRIFPKEKNSGVFNPPPPSCQRGFIVRFISQ